MDAHTQMRYRDETRWLLVRRGPLCALLLSISVFVSDALEYAYHPERLEALLGFTVVELGIWAAVMCIYRVRAMERFVLEVTQLGCAALVMCVAGYFTITRADPPGLAFVIIVFQLMTALVFPWGWRRQVTMALTGVVAYGGFLYGAGSVGATTPPASYELAAVIVAGLFSVVGAAVLDRQRATVFAQREQLDRQMTTFRDLTQTLHGFDPQRVFLMTCIATLQAFSLRRLWAVWQDPAGGRIHGYLARRAGEDEAADVTMDALDQPVPLWNALVNANHSGQAVLAHDVAPRVAAALGARDVGPLLSVPIRFEGEDLGALCADRGGEPFDLDARELALASVLAGGAAIAMANARLYQRAAAASEEKSTFLARIAHELRNPVHTALWDIDTLRRQAGAPQALLERLRQNTLRTLDAAQELQEFAEIETRRLAVQSEAVNLPQLLDDIEATAVALLEGRPIAFEMRIAEDVSVVESDPYRLRQILGNLVSNAAKFTRAGRIVLEAGRVKGDVVIAVRDSGIGIKAADLASIFEPFWRGATIGPVPTRGMGLGLAIAQELATRLGGRIEADSEPGEGSTFRLFLPAGQDRRGAASAGRGNGAAASRDVDAPIDVPFVSDDAGVSLSRRAPA